MRLVGLTELSEAQEQGLKGRLRLRYEVTRLWVTRSGYTRVDMFNKNTNAVKSLYWYKDSWRVAK